MGKTTPSTVSRDARDARAPIANDDDDEKKKKTSSIGVVTTRYEAFHARVDAVFAEVGRRPSTKTSRGDVEGFARAGREGSNEAWRPRDEAVVRMGTAGDDDEDEDEDDDDDDGDYGTGRRAIDDDIDCLESDEDEDDDARRMRRLRASVGRARARCRITWRIRRSIRDMIWATTRRRLASRRRNRNSPVKNCRETRETSGRTRRMRARRPHRETRRRDLGFHERRRPRRGDRSAVAKKTRPARASPFTRTTTRTRREKGETTRTMPRPSTRHLDARVVSVGSNASHVIPVA